MIKIGVVENDGILKVLGALYEDYPQEERDLKNFTYDNTVSINLIYDIDGNLVGNGPYSTNIHYYNGVRYMDDYIVKDLKDGVYTFKLLILPTKEHLEEDLGIVDGRTYTELKSMLEETGYSVEMDEDPGFIMVAFNTETGQIEQAAFLGSEDPYDHTFWILWQEASFEDVVDAFNYIDHTSMKLVETKFVNYYNLYKCFISRALDLLSIYNGNEDFCTGSKLCVDKLEKKYSQEIQIRDYLWAAINVLKYCSELGNWEYAQKILNCVSSCSGICGSSFDRDSTNGCGCC